MADATVEEGWHQLQDGKKLYKKIWKAQPHAVARMIFIHGFSDHCNAYGPLFPALQSRGIEVISFDQRGWGRSVSSPHEKGDTGPTHIVIADISSVVSDQLASQSQIPLFLMGHSMGGGEVLTWAATAPADLRKRIKGYLVESPLVALDPATQPGKMLYYGSILAGKLLPKRQMIQKLDPNLVSRDPEVCKSFADDPLCHDTGTLEGLSGMLDRGAHLVSGKVAISEVDPAVGKVHIWLSHGTGDRITSCSATKTLFEKMKVADKEFKEYLGWYHKLHAEPGQDHVTFANDVADWMLARSENREVGSSTGTPKL